MESIMLAEREIFLKDQPGNKGHGFYERFVDRFQGKFRIQIPRDRQGYFHPLVLEVLKHDTHRFQELALKLYSHSVSHRGVCEVFDELFGKTISPGCLSQWVKAFETQRKAWQQSPLDETYHAILVDGIYHSIRRGSVDKEPLYVVLGLKKDHTRECLGLYPLPTETAEGWKTVFKDLTARGVSEWV